MTVVAATLTFGASLTTLVSHPALYGWDFDYALYAVQGWGPVPARWADPLLAHDRLVAATTGVNFATVQVDGQTVPAMVTPTHPAVAPHVLSGHGLDSSHDVVLGPATLAALHQRVGGTVTLSSGSLPRPAHDRGHGHDAGDRRRAERSSLDEHRGRCSPRRVLPGNASRPVRPLPDRPQRHPRPAAARHQRGGRPAVDAVHPQAAHRGAELAAGTGRQRRRVRGGQHRPAARPAAGRDRELQPRWAPCPRCWPAGSRPGRWLASA